MTLPPFYPVLDVDVASTRGWTVPELARACFAGGARLVQVRGKQLPGGPLLEIVDAVMASAPPDAIVLVNDRPDVARLAGAAGVHVGQEDVPVAAARAIVGPGAIVGVSTHTAEQIGRALAEPLSYLAVGHVYPTGTKPADYDAVGLEFVRRAASRSAVPVVAIGGITLDRAPDLIRAGAASVAVVSDLFTTSDPESRAREFVARLANIGRTVHS